MIYLIYLSLLMLTTFFSYGGEKENIGQIKEYEIAEKDEKEFLLNLQALPRELQLEILEKTYQHDFEPSIGKQGAYVQLKQLPSGEGESEEKKNYWQSLKNPLKRFTFIEEDNRTAILYNHVKLGYYNVASISDPCRHILGPNKQSLIIAENNPSTLNCYHLSQSSKIQTIKPELPHYKIDTFYCLHPKKNYFVFGQNNPSDRFTTLHLYSLSNDQIPQKYELVTEHVFHSIEFNSEDSESDKLIGINDNSIYELDIASVLNNPSDLQVLPTPEVKEIANVYDLVNTAIEKNNLDKNYKDMLCLKRILFSNKIPGIFIAHLNHNTTLLCDRYAQNQVIKVLQYPTEQSNYNFSHVSFCQPSNIFRNNIYGPESYDNVLVITPKQEFLDKKIKAIAATAKGLQEKTQQTKN